MSRWRREETLKAAALADQYRQAALAKWRTANAWADDIQFSQFPQRYKDEIEAAASILENGGTQ